MLLQVRVLKDHQICQIGFDLSLPRRPELPDTRHLFSLGLLSFMLSVLHASRLHNLALKCQYFAGVCQLLLLLPKGPPLLKLLEKELRVWRMPLLDITPVVRQRRVVLLAEVIVAGRGKATMTVAHEGFPT